jgi:hypothetical protein
MLAYRAGRMASPASRVWRQHDCRCSNESLIGCIVSLVPTVLYYVYTLLFEVGTIWLKYNFRTICTGLNGKHCLYKGKSAGIL